jgi:hypothetical protein
VYGIQAENTSSGVSKGPVLIQGNDIYGFSMPAGAKGIWFGGLQNYGKVRDNYIQGFTACDIEISGGGANNNVGFEIVGNTLDSTATNSIKVGTGCEGEIRRNKIAAVVSIDPGAAMVMEDQSGAGANAASEGWRTIGSSGHAAFTGTWTAQAGYTAPRYRLRPGKKVELGGRATTGTANTTVTNLPAAFRPPLERAFITMANDTAGVVAITNTGDVWLKGGQTTNYNLDGIEYSLI